MVKFEVAELPKMPNGLLRKHYRIVTKEKNHWLNWVIFSVAYQRPRKPYQKAFLTLERHSTQEPDYDGLVGSFKYVIDALVKAGILIDDKPSVISCSYVWKKSKLKDQGIRVSVREINA